jgi:hypothetical protein
MQGDKSRSAVKILITEKTKEIEQYYLQHKNIIKPFLLLKKEREELKSQEINIMMNQVDILLPPKKSKRK